MGTGCAAAPLRLARSTSCVPSLDTIADRWYPGIAAGDPDFWPRQQRPHGGSREVYQQSCDTGPRRAEDQQELSIVLQSSPAGTSAALAYHASTGALIKRVAIGHRLRILRSSTVYCTSPKTRGVRPVPRRMTSFAGYHDVQIWRYPTADALAHLLSKSWGPGHSCQADEDSTRWKPMSSPAIPHLLP